MISWNKKEIEMVMMEYLSEFSRYNLNILVSGTEGPGVWVHGGFKSFGGDSMR